MSIELDRFSFSTDSFRIFFIISYLLLVISGFIFVIFGLIYVILGLFLLFIICYGIYFNSSREVNLNEQLIKCLSFITGPHYYSAIVGLTVLLAILFRIYKLSDMHIYINDEWTVMISAWRLSEVGFVDYKRAEVVTYFIHFFIDLFGRSIFITKIPSILIGSLTVIPLYLITKRFSKIAGVIAGFLWAISPWAIYMDRLVREYAYFPFFLLIVFLLCLILTNNIIDYYNNISNFSLINYGYILIISINLLYAKFFDWSSTYKFIFLLIPSVLLYLFFRIITIHSKKLENKNYKVFKYCALIFTILALFIAYLFFSEKYNPFWLDLLYNFSIIQWFLPSNISLSAIAIIILFGILFVGISNRNYEIFQILFSFIFVCLYFSFFEDLQSESPRYFFYILPLYIILISVGIYSIIMCIHKIFNKNKYGSFLIFLFIALFLIIFNPLNSINAVVWDEKFNPFLGGTENYYNNPFELSELQSLITTNDIIITSNPSAIRWIFNYTPSRDNFSNRTGIRPDGFDATCEKIFYYWHPYNYKFDLTSDIINSHEGGWIILSEFSNKNPYIYGFPRHDFYVNSNLVNYYGLIGGHNVYNWGKNESI
jgi:hypothetical protein